MQRLDGRSLMAVGENVRLTYGSAALFGPRSSLIVELLLN